MVIIYNIISYIYITFNILNVRFPRHTFPRIKSLEKIK